MPDYIPKARYPEELAQRVYEAKSQRTDPWKTLADVAGSVGGTYFKAKKEKAEATEKRKVELSKETQAHIAALVKEGLFEVDTELLKSDPEHIEKAITKYVPYKERSKVASVSAKNQPADPIRIKTLESMINMYNRQADPNAKPYKIDSSVTHTAEAIDNEIARFSKASGITEARAVKMAQEIPSKKLMEASEEATRKTAEVLSAQPPVEAGAPSKAKIESATKDALVPIAKGPNTGKTVLDVLKSYPDYKSRHDGVMSYFKFTSDEADLFLTSNGLK